MALEYRHVLCLSGPKHERDAFRTAHLLQRTLSDNTSEVRFDWSELLPIPTEHRAPLTEADQDGIDLYFGDADAIPHARKKLSSLLPGRESLSDEDFRAELTRLAPALFENARRLQETKERTGAVDRTSWVAAHWGCDLPFDTQIDLPDETLLIYFRTEDGIPIPILTLLSKRYPLLTFDLEWIEEVEMTEGHLTAVSGNILIRGDERDPS